MTLDPNWAYFAVFVVSVLLTVGGSLVPSLTMRSGAGIFWIASMVFTLLSTGLNAIVVTVITLACIYLSIMSWVQMATAISQARKKSAMMESMQEGSSSSQLTPAEKQLIRQNNALMKMMTQKGGNE
jgi:predicted membrane protein